VEMAKKPQGGSKRENGAGGDNKEKPVHKMEASKCFNPGRAKDETHEVSLEEERHLQTETRRRNTQTVLVQRKGIVRGQTGARTFEARHAVQDNFSARGTDQIDGTNLQHL